MERGTPGGAKAELRDIVAATDWARLESFRWPLARTTQLVLPCQWVHDLYGWIKEQIN